MESLIHPHSKRTVGTTNFWLVLCLGIFFASYLVIRYGGLWSENDTAIFTHDALLTARYHTTIFPTQYPHGFGYQLWLAILQMTTHMPAGYINTTILPFIGVGFTLVLAFVTYKELMEHVGLSELAILLILAVPDIMFTVLRGNHEKLTVILLLASVFVLVRFLKSSRTKERLLWELIFYFLIATNGVVNDYFTVMSIWGMATYLLIGGIFSWRTGFPSGRSLLAVVRLLFISMVLVSIDVWIVYPPAHADVQLAVQALQRLKALFATHRIASNPLSSPVQQWVDVPIYLVVSIFRWIVVFGSFAVWLLTFLRPLRQKEALSVPTLIMISMYAATAILVAVAVPVDLTGLAAGSNLEVRNYTYFALFAVPFVALGISQLLSMTNRKRYKKGVLVATVLLVPFLLIMSLLKSTLDPLISNQWMFYSASEKQAVLFYLRHRGAAPGFLWAGPDERLRNAAATWWPGPIPWYVSGGGTPAFPSFSFWLWSPNIATNSVELKDPLPSFHNQNLIYSNGTTKLYAARPASPFEVHP